MGVLFILLLTVPYRGRKCKLRSPFSTKSYILLKCVACQSVLDHTQAFILQCCLKTMRVAVMRILPLDLFSLVGQTESLYKTYPSFDICVTTLLPMFMCSYTFYFMLHVRFTTALLTPLAFVVLYGRYSCKLVSLSGQCLFNLTWSIPELQLEKNHSFHGCSISVVDNLWFNLTKITKLRIIKCFN